MFREMNESEVFCNPESAEQNEGERISSQNILCKACFGKVTTKNDQFEKNNQDEHCFFNPHGVAFVISCFHRAHCIIHGESSYEFTWFKGYAWSLAMCVQCREHLGWFFEGRGGDSFYGLIVDKLVEMG